MTPCVVGIRGDIGEDVAIGQHDMKDRTSAGLYLEMTNAPLNDYVDVLFSTLCLLAVMRSRRTT